MTEKQIKPKIGSTISFGGYDWRVLDTQGDKALLLSDKVLESRFYHESQTVTTWADCDLRSHLNGEFYDLLGEDKTRIAKTTVTTEDNPWYGTYGGTETYDKLFLLSIEEIVKYFGDSGQLENRPNGGVDYISDKYNSARRASDEHGMALYWWLRLPGYCSINAAYVLTDGYLDVGQPTPRLKPGACTNAASPG